MEWMGWVGCLATRALAVLKRERPVVSTKLTIHNNHCNQQPRVYYTVSHSFPQQTGIVGTPGCPPPSPPAPSSPFLSWTACI